MNLSIHNVTETKLEMSDLDSNWIDLSVKDKEGVEFEFTMFTKNSRGKIALLENLKARSKWP